MNSKLPCIPLNLKSDGTEKRSHFFLEMPCLFVLLWWHQRWWVSWTEDRRKKQRLCVACKNNSNSSLISKGNSGPSDFLDWLFLTPRMQKVPRSKQVDWAFGWALPTPTQLGREDSGMMQPQAETKIQGPLGLWSGLGRIGRRWPDKVGGKLLNMGEGRKQGGTMIQQYFSDFSMSVNYLGIC